MDDEQATGSREAGPDSAFTFTGTWSEYWRIALTNLLLTLVTLGIYRFWAKARERRYLWSRTHFIDDAFEWTGTGKEMFIGFVIVFAILLPVFFGLRMLIEGMMMRGETVAAMALALLLYVGVFYLIGVARFRALRYRLSRTLWHGIRGGSEDGGWYYGVQHMWKTVVGFLPFGLMVPWSMASLWNDRWGRMSFGRHPFEAHANTDGLFARWLLVYLVPVLGVVLMGGAMGAVMAGGGSSEGAFVAIGLMTLLLYVAFLLASLSYYAVFFRRVAAATSVAGIDFAFTARTKDWLRLILGNIGLVIVTLGIAIFFLAYRNWKFVVRHMEATGEVNLDTLLQSLTPAPADAEGLADAFDLGAM